VPGIYTDGCLGHQLLTILRCTGNISENDRNPSKKTRGAAKPLQILNFIQRKLDYNSDGYQVGFHNIMKTINNNTKEDNDIS
jgi:hypothetical protein